MKELELSTMFDTTASSGMSGAFFDAFTESGQIKVKTRHMEWPDAWTQLVNIALSSQGPDLSEIGTTWLGSFQTMESLRPFTTTEAGLLGGEFAYPPAIWQACQVSRNNPILAVPLTLDVRVLLYRRDWLQKAGVEESSAFVDAGHVRETLRKLKAAGHPGPLGISTAHSRNRFVHDLASWVWSAGGDLRSDDGRFMRLMDPQSRTGMEAYFGLNEFIAPEMQALAEAQVQTAFFAGKTAVAVSKECDYLIADMNRSSVSDEVAANMGLAMLMQAPYVGGSAVAIWRHSSHSQDAIELIKFLNSPAAWKSLNTQVPPYTPARLDVLERAPLAATPFYPAIRKSLENGRSCQSGYRWSGVEARLAAVIEQLWSDLRANPGLNIAHEVDVRFSDLCSRLEGTILVSS